MDLPVSSGLWPLASASNLAVVAAACMSVPLVRSVKRAWRIAERGERIKTIIDDSLLSRIGEIQAVRFSRAVRVPEPAPYNELRTIYFECRYLVVRLLGVPVHCEGDEVQVPDDIVAVALSGRPVSAACMNRFFDPRLAVPAPRLGAPARSSQHLQLQSA